MVVILPFESHAPAESVSELAQRRLQESPYFFLKRITCHFQSGVLTLRGTVPLWQLRQFAESIVTRIDGVHQIDNQVEVFDPMTMPANGRAVRSAG